VEIVKFLRDEKANTLFITTDVHFSEVFKYTPFKDSSYSFHEVVVGPGNAGLFPNRAFDKTIGNGKFVLFRVGRCRRRNDLERGSQMVQLRHHSD